MSKSCADPTHPLRHAVMACIDKVARSQGGGAWSGCPDPQGGEVVVPTSRAEATPGGRGLKYECTVPLTGDESEPPLAKRIKCTESQYLCTGYDAYCTAEPCIM